MAEPTTVETEGLQEEIDALVAQRLGLKIQVTELKDESQELTRRQTTLANALVENARKLKPLIQALGLDE